MYLIMLFLYNWGYFYVAEADSKPTFDGVECSAFISLLIIKSVISDRYQIKTVLTYLLTALLVIDN